MVIQSPERAIITSREKARTKFVYLCLPGVLLCCALLAGAQQPAKPAQLATPEQAANPPQPAVSAPVDEAAQLARAQTLLKQARAALGSDEAWNKLQNLVVRLRLESFIKYVSVQGPDKIEEKERTLYGKIDLDFALPDRFRRKLTTQTLGIYNYSFAEIVNGDKAWRDPPMQVRSSQGDGRVLDVSDVDRTLNMQTQSALQQLSLYTLMFLLKTPAAVSVKWRDEGVIRLLDSTWGSEGRPVQVLMGVTPDNFRLFILLNPETQFPVGIALAYVEALRENVIPELATIDRNYMRRTFQRVGQERRARTKPARIHEMRWLLSDYRAVNGVLLPQRIDVTRDGEVLLETLTVREVAADRTINPKKFDGEPRVQWGTRPIN